MIKKKNILFILLIIISSIIIITNCTVNEYTSKITITNKSDINVSNIKIGDIIICGLLAPGASYDYFFVADLYGPFSSNEAAPARYPSFYNTSKNSAVSSKGDFDLKSDGYYFESDIFKRDDKYYITLRCEKHAFNYLSDNVEEYVISGFYKGD